ncbi:hypothetical protein NX794_14510 [Streptomyces sp. LP11]|uniref:Uncharacterized protein n=1 Tax=Streptomyces pyxinicus TaxID=2970331 RepID=A0ABT2B1R5_9ACTN|nr:hypothetical protein [Streptomyces sp. LP11]MCS0602414.1 hypothetical protein [Streptomyces sp. LP11]
MEQRIGASSKPSETEPAKPEPLTGAGFDPAFIPGLTTPAPVPTQAGPGAGAGEPEDSAEEPSDSAPDPKSDSDSDSVSASESESESESDAEASSDGPVFEAADRRARIEADAKGVRLRLDEESCEFRWDEIAAVETETPRFGKRYTVTVHTPDNRWYPIEIEATSRSRFAEWDAELDAVLDAYFDDGGDATDAEVGKDAD